jgi:radical SAM superfamily enzyme YgiQ (UPF0313 family)
VADKEGKRRNIKYKVQSTKYKVQSTKYKVQSTKYKVQNIHCRFQIAHCKLKKVLLINTNIEKAPYPVPPVGLCMLASVLEKEYIVKVYDGVFDEGRNLVPLVKEFSPDFIGFSIRNIDDVVANRPIYYIDRILSDFIEPVKKITSVPIILGGSGFSIFPEELMKITGADYGIRGEAEVLLPELLKRIEKKLDAGELPNVLTNNVHQSSHITDTVPNLTPLKNPGGTRGAGWGAIDRYIDFAPYLRKGVYSIQTKRGCSHGCIYCTYPLIEGRRFRRRSPESIADEIEKARGRLGDVTFEFVDSTFNDPEGHAEAICREIIRRKIKVRLRTMGINPRNASEELFGLMMEAGFRQIDATPDSASERILKNLDKGFKLREVRKMAKLIRKFDLPTMWFFLFGGPGESAETLEETLRFIEEFVNPEDLVYLSSGLRVYPGTPLCRIALEEGRIRPDRSLLYPPVFYFSDKIGKETLDRYLEDVSRQMFNCIPSAETAPPPEMVKEANEMRTRDGLDEPMFRTLLRIRRKWME